MELTKRYFFGTIIEGLNFKDYGKNEIDFERNEKVEYSDK